MSGVLRGMFSLLWGSSPSQFIDRAWVSLEHHGVVALAADSTGQPCASSDAYGRFPLPCDL